MRPLVVLFAVIFALLSAPAAGAEPGTFDLQAHRGGRGETTEESSRAFAKALELGVSTLEFDVVITADHQALVWHDPQIDAAKCADTAPASPSDPQFPYVGKLVHDLTLAQIATLRCGKLLPDYPDAEVIADNRILTLPEVFALTDSYHADVRYNIETKLEASKPETSASPQEFVDIILAAVRAAGKVSHTDIQSFDWRTLPMVAAAEPSIPLVALWDDTTFVPGSVWLNGIDPALTPDPIEAARQVGADILSPEYPIADASFIERAHAQGLKVIPWTVNDADDMVALINAGADGIITDYPTRARTVLGQLGMPLPQAYFPA